MAKYYESQSSGRYSVNGDVTEWVKVPFNEARYGRNYCGSIDCNNTWLLIRDALAYWVDGQLEAGKTLAEITDYLEHVRQAGSLRHDGDGNFDEPDGYIDHFQIVHAGGDEAAGDPQQGTDAIWSHRWYANFQHGGPNGVRRQRRTGRRLGGVTIPSNPTGCLGRRLHRRSRRTAASACSPTSSATTSACRTSTTPPATPAVPRTRPASGR